MTYYDLAFRMTLVGITLAAVSFLAGFLMCNDGPLAKYYYTKVFKSQPAEKK